MTLLNRTSTSIQQHTVSTKDTSQEQPPSGESSDVDDSKGGTQAVSGSISVNSKCLFMIKLYIHS